jgi:outer membrane biosynthesis protein TonB
MFPNVRLMIAAVAASILALCCGFAMFAAFRVNHEPLSRLAAGNAPLQLAADSTAPSAAMLPAGQPFGARFELIQAQPAAAAAVAPAQAAAVVQDAAAAPEAKQDDAAVPPPESPAAAAATTTTDTAAIEPAPEPEQAAPAEQAASAEQAPPAEPAAAAEQPTQAAATEPTAEIAPQTATTAAAASPAEARQKTVRRQRLAARARRARGAIARAIGQPIGRNATAPRPIFQTARSVSPASGIGGPFVPPTNH